MSLFKKYMEMVESNNSNIEKIKDDIYAIHHSDALELFFDYLSDDILRDFHKKYISDNTESNTNLSIKKITDDIYENIHHGDALEFLFKYLPDNVLINFHKHINREV